MTTTAPDPDEIEVTLLGPGVGECVVVHLGAGHWLIVDSYDDHGVPAARRYLDGLGVSPEQVDVLVVTHVHRDHYEGIGLLHDYYREAALHVPAAMGHATFAQVWGIDMASDGEMLGGLVGAFARAKTRRPPSGRSGLRKLAVNGVVLRVADVTVRALSPSDAAVIEGDAALAEVLKTGDPLAVANHLKRQNATSAVLHVDAGHCAVLLGADLEVSPHRHGWHAIIGNPDMPDLTRSSLVKVAHHGSDNADHDVIWQHLATDEPHLLVAPYWPSRLPRPERDIPRLRGRGHCLWQAAPSSTWNVRPDGAQVSLPRRTGRVTARRRPSDPEWRITHVPPAPAPMSGSGSGAPTCAVAGVA
jgi:hypothetical protein